MVSQHGSHGAVSTTNQNFLGLEHSLLTLLMENKDSGNFTHVSVQGRNSNRRGLAVAGTQYGEILPPWVDPESGEASMSLRGAAP